jgi:hypothetical protein
MTTLFGEQLENCPGLETVVLVRRSYVLYGFYLQCIRRCQALRGEYVATLIEKRLKKQFIRDRFVGLRQSAMGRQFEIGQAERRGVFVSGGVFRGGLVRLSHHLTAEVHERPVITSLRLLAVLNVLSEYACARQAARASY